MSKNYYDILGVKKDATKKEIQKKYRKLSLQYHPDRQNGKSDEEKKESEEKFKEISEAYSILSDDNKRQQYDMFGTVNNHASTMTADDIFEQMAAHYGFSTKSKTHLQKGESIKIGVNVTLEEIYNNSEILIKYKRYVQCKECKGTGSKDGNVENCLYCKGTGKLRQRFDNPHEVFIHEVVCPYCKGKGKTFKESCGKCNGSGLEIKEEELKIQIPNGCCNNAYTVIEGAGNAVANNGGINGDLIVIFHVVESSIYSIDPNNPYNIIRNLELPVLDCITGCSCEIMGINGKKYKITIQPNTLHNHKLRLKENGLVDAYGNKGDMLICVKMKMPSQPLSKKENELISELKQNKNFQ